LGNPYLTENFFRTNSTADKFSKNVSLNSDIPEFSAIESERIFRLATVKHCRMILPSSPDS